MPNWCSTEYTVRGSKKDIARIYDEMQKALSANPLKAGFGDLWLGNLLHHIGIPDKEVIEGPIRCRGSVIDYRQDYDDTLTIVTETAWAPMAKVIMKFCETYAEEPLEYLYIAEECGMAIYESNNPDVIGSILFDVWEHDESLPDALNELEYDTFEEGDACDIMREALGLEQDDDTSTETLINMIDERFGEYMSVHQYEYCDIEDLD